MSSSTEWYRKHPGKKAEADKKYRLEHREELREKARISYAVNLEKYKEYRKKYYQDNKSLSSKRNKEWILANPEKNRGYKRKWATNNQDKIRAHRVAVAPIISIKNKERYRANGEPIKDRARNRWRNLTPEQRLEHNKKRRERYAKNPDIRNIPAILRQATDRVGFGKITKLEWKEVCEKYGNKCYYCGSTGKITLEHLLPVSRGGTNELSNLRPACPSCNYSKHNKTPEEYYLWLKTHGKPV